MRIRPFGHHVRILCIYMDMRIPLSLSRLLQNLLDTSLEDCSGVKCPLASWLVKRKVLNSALEELLGERTDVEDPVEFAVVVNVPDITDSKAL